MSAFSWTDPYTTPVLFVGDSIMAGNTGFGAGTYEAVADYVPTLPRLSQYNYAVPGTSIQNMTNVQVPAAITAGDDDFRAIIALSGLNNIAVGNSLSQMQTFTTNFFNYVDGLAQNPRLMMCAIMPFHDSTAWTADRQIICDNYNRWLCQQCVARGYDFADAYRRMGEAADPTYTRDQWRADNTHLNATGCAYYGDMIAAVATRRFDKQVQAHG